MLEKLVCVGKLLPPEHPTSSRPWEHTGSEWLSGLTSVIASPSSQGHDLATLQLIHSTWRKKHQEDSMIHLRKKEGKA